MSKPVQLNLDLEKVPRKKHHKCPYHDSTCANRLASGSCSHRSMSKQPYPTEHIACPWWRRKTLPEPELQALIKSGVLHRELSEAE